jgi:hypothetical protein
VRKRSLPLVIAALAALAAPASAARLSGRVRYRDKELSSADGSVTGRPMKACRYVQLLFARGSSPGTVLGTVSTDANGSFTSPDLGSHADIVVFVTASGLHRGQDLEVRDQEAGGGNVHTFQSGEFDLSAGDVANQTIDITADAAAGAFNIYDQFIRGYDYTLDQFFATPPTVAQFSVVARWELGLDNAPGVAAGTYFWIVGGQLQFNILGDDAVDSDHFDDAILLHEYGHLIAQRFSRDNSPGGPHAVDAVQDIRLAFSEGWAHFFSAAVRNDAFLVDTTALGAFIYEIATPGVVGVPGFTVTGPENELAVAAILWDILNSTALAINNGAIDTAREAIWDIVDRYLPSAGVTDVSLEDFWDGWFEDDVTPSYGLPGFTLVNKNTLIAIAQSHGVRYVEDDHEPNASQNDATTIIPDQDTLDGTHYYDDNSNGLGQNDEDWYQFSATQNKTYTIETLNIGNAGDTRIELYEDDDDGLQLLASNDDADATTLASRIQHTVQNGGRHYIRVTRSTKRLPVVGFAANGARATYGTYSIRVGEGGTAPTGPRVLSVTPTDGATGVAVGTSVVVTFSAAVQIDTVTTASFTLTAVTTPVAGTVALSADRKTATFTPTNPLLRSTTYTVALTRAIKDDNGGTLTPFTSTFTTEAAPAVQTVPRVPRAQIAAGDGFVDIEWIYPTPAHDGVIVAVARDRFPTVAVVDGQLTVSHGSEVYRGSTETRVQIPTTNNQRAFVCIWTFIGTATSRPYCLASRAANGGRGIREPFDPDADEAVATQGPTLPKPVKFQVVSGNGYVDVEWVERTGDFDGVIVAVGSSVFPELKQVVTDGAVELKLTRGTELVRGGGTVRFRLATTNDSKRLFCIWTYKGTEFSRPRYGTTRASRGGAGLSEVNSFYGNAFEEPEVIQ